jgi:hypothetical protein
MQESSHHQFRREKVGEQKVSDSCVYHVVAASACVHFTGLCKQKPLISTNGLLSVYL